MFGWVVIGREQTDKTYTNDLQTFFVSSGPENLRRFWEIEEVPAAQLWTAEEKRCDDHFKETTRRSPEGRFIVKLPFKNETKALGDSLQQAKKRLRNPTFIRDTQNSLESSFISDTRRKFQHQNLSSLLKTATIFVIIVCSRSQALPPS